MPDVKPLSAEEIAELREWAAGRRHEREADSVRLVRLLDEVERTRALLRRIEFKGEFDDCPECQADEGHAPGCDLAALLGGEPASWRSRLQAIITELDREHTTEALALANRLNGALLGGEG